MVAGEALGVSGDEGTEGEVDGAVDVVAVGGVVAASGVVVGGGVGRQAAASIAIKADERAVVAARGRERLPGICRTRIPSCRTNPARWAPSRPGSLARRR